MVGLVVVSHSVKLAEGVAELMRDAAGAEVRIATAGGMDLADQPFGTDANLIHRAIEEVYSEDGVAVLVDLGSAILSTELALEMLTPEQRAHVVLAPAPLVEGGIAAAVQAGVGYSLEQVVAEARAALDAKLAQHGFAPAVSFTPPSMAPLPPGDALAQELVLSVNNLLGLHARPAAKFVRIAASFNAEVRVEDLTTGQGPVNAKSINAVTTLGVLHGHEIKILAYGPQARAALDAFQALANENFGDDAATDARLARVVKEIPAEEGELVGLKASGGYGIGPARVYKPMLPPIPMDTVADTEREAERLTQAIEQAQAKLVQARDAVDGRGRPGDAEIFDAQLLMLQDQALQDPARRAILVEKQNAARAMDWAAEQIASQYEALTDEYQRARAADVRAVARLVLMNLLDAPQGISFGEGVLVAPDLTPAETAQLDPKSIRAICTAYGGPTGHSAILAKGLGIPAVVGLGEHILAVGEGTTLIVDGERGRVWVNPDEELVAKYEALGEKARREREKVRARRNEPAVTRDGHRVEIAANIGSVVDAEQAVELGAEAVGLFRTEFLFLNRGTAPSEEEQYEAYWEAAEILHPRSLLIRTLDIGGDKPIPFAPVAHEQNPFLGLRGLRLSLAEPALFKTQLRAILRVANDHNVRVMFPMVATVPEFLAAKKLLGEAREELRERGVEAAERIEMGIMVEVPSAALSAKLFAREVDFFSIGTNDLTQYTLAAERGNPSVAELADWNDPAVLRLIANVIREGHAQNKWVGVCGEMAGDDKAIPLLVGMGVDELSMPAPLIAGAKEIVRGLSYATMQVAAEEMLR